MKIVFPALLFVIFLMYFYVRLPKETKIKKFFDKNPLWIGHFFVVFWSIVFIFIQPKLAILYVPVMIGGAFYLAKKRKS